MCDDLEGEALATLVVNKLRGTFSALAVKAPGYGDRRKEMLARHRCRDRRDGHHRGFRPQARFRDARGFGQRHTRSCPPKTTPRSWKAKGDKMAVDARVASCANRWKPRILNLTTRSCSGTSGQARGRRGRHQGRRRDRNRDEGKEASHRRRGGRDQGRGGRGYRTRRRHRPHPGIGGSRMRLSWKARKPSAR